MPRPTRARPSPDRLTQDPAAAPRAAAPDSEGYNAPRHFRTTWVAYALVAPQLLIIFVFFYWPAAQALYWAFTLEQPLGGGNTWVGFQNFRNTLSDPYYWSSVRASVIFALAPPPLPWEWRSSLPFADRQLRGYGAWRIAVIWPYAIAAPAVGLAFRFVFNPNAGSFPTSTRPAGFLGPHDQRRTGALHRDHRGRVETCLLQLHLLLAALQSIPRSLTEAAAMDGAG